MSEEIIKRLGNMNPEDVREVYNEYSRRWQHFHKSVWISTIATLSVILATLLFIVKSTPFIAVIIGSLDLIILVIGWRISYGNTLQWREAINLANAIEIHWGLRSVDNGKGPLLSDPQRGGKLGVTKKARLLLFLTAGAVVFTLVILKFVWPESLIPLVND